MQDELELDCVQDTTQTPLKVRSRILARYTLTNNTTKVCSPPSLTNLTNLAIFTLLSKIGSIRFVLFHLLG